MFFITTGTMPGAFFFMFLLPFLLPIILKVLSGMALALSGGTAEAQQVRPAGATSPSTQQAFNAAKAEFPAQMLDLDNELTLQEEFGTDLNADELKTARTHLNKAFATYSKTFGNGDHTTVDVTNARRSVSRDLAAATRHLGLADPNSPLHNEPAPAPKVETKEDELFRRFGVARGEHADTPLATAPRQAQAQPARRSSGLVLTPFGLMIGF